MIQGSVLKKDKCWLNASGQSATWHVIYNSLYKVQAFQLAYRLGPKTIHLQKVKNVSVWYMKSIVDVLMVYTVFKNIAFVIFLPFLY